MNIRCLLHGHKWEKHREDFILNLPLSNKKIKECISIWYECQICQKQIYTRAHIPSMLICNWQSEFPDEILTMVLEKWMDNKLVEKKPVAYFNEADQKVYEVNFPEIIKLRNNALNEMDDIPIEIWSSLDEEYINDLKHAGLISSKDYNSLNKILNCA